MKKDEITNEWCKFNPKYKHKDPKYGNIVDFFLWSCPAPNTTYGAKTLNDYGWKGGNNFKKLKRKIVSEHKILFNTPKNEELLEILEKCNQLNNCTNKEIIVLLKPSQGEMETLFRSIRNAFAHGSFRVTNHNKEYFYLFENRNPKNESINARIVLKSTTLFSWINIVKTGPNT